MALCFGSFAKAIKGVKKSPKTNVATAELLLALITDNVEVFNQKGDPFVVTDKNASLYLNCKDHLLQALVDASGNDSVVQAAEARFRDAVIPELEPLLIDNLLSDICMIINSDGSIPHNLRTELTTAASKENPAAFLARAFLYAIKRENKLPPMVAAANSDDLMRDAISEFEKVEEILKKYPRPQAIAVPELPEEEEMDYIRALLDVYAEEMECDGAICLNDLEGSVIHKKDLLRRRKDYYAAEAIRVGTRDSFGDTEETNFSVLKEDILDSVYDTYVMPYRTSMERLTHVMNQAAASPANRCVLLSKLDWVCAREKKGVCHFLVKDGELKWVSDDE